MAFFVDYFHFPGASNVVAQTPPKVSYFDRRPTDASRAIVKGHHESTLFLSFAAMASLTSERATIQRYFLAISHH
jgi:hypothetical protein